MQHQIPISATFTLFKYFNLTPTFNYTERWYTNKTENYYDEEKRQWVATDTIYGFNRVSNYNFSLGLSTKLYGMYKPLFIHVVPYRIADWNKERNSIYYHPYLRAPANIYQTPAPRLY